MKDNKYFGLTGAVITSTDQEYEEATLSWNRAIQKRPAVIVFCEKVEDIKNAIKWSKENNMSFRIRSGRHHYEGFSTGDDLLVIDVSKLNKIELNEEKGIVKIQAGTRNREIYEVLNSKNYPFPGGGCPTVGAVAYTLGGGWGYSARFLGLGCDNLLELEMMNFNGEIIKANKDENKDLFWALRGAGGGNFGVVLSMTFKLAKKVEMATLVRIDYKNTTLEESIKVVEAVQEEFKTIDNRFNAKMAVYNSKENGKGVFITGLFYGTKEEAESVLKPFENLANITEFDLRYMRVLEANREIQDSHPDYEKYKSGGRVVKRDYNKEEIKNLIEIIDTRAKGSIYTAVSLYGLGGNIRNLSKEETAFTYRDANFIMGFQSVWEEDKFADINKEWFLERFKIIKELTDGSFISFPLKEIDNYKKEYYADDLDKLERIKAKYDPENLFDFPQRI